MSKSRLHQKLRDKLEIAVMLAHPIEYDLAKKMNDKRINVDYEAFAKIYDYSDVELFWNGGVNIDPLIFVAYRSANETVKNVFENWLFYTTGTMTKKEINSMLKWMNKHEG